MTFVGHYVIKVLILTFIQVHLSFQQGVFQFVNIKEERKAYKLRSGRCCGTKKVDSENNCNVPCQIVFSMCLFKFGDKNQLCLIDVESSQPITPQMKKMDIEFSKIFGEPLSMNLTARDLNSRTVDDVIFQSTYNHPLSFDSRNWNHVSAASTNQLLSFSYRLSCGPNLYGKGCNILCIPKDNAEGHYNCADNGDRVCYPDWYGEYCDRTCDCNIDPGFSHGTCQQDGSCLCDFGWGGMYCNKDMGLCITRPCQNGGTCNRKTGFCHCPTTSSGRYCEHLIVSPSPSAIVSTTLIESSFSQTQTRKTLNSKTQTLSNLSTKMSSNASTRKLNTLLSTSLSQSTEFLQTSQIEVFPTRSSDSVVQTRAYSTSCYKQQSSSINTGEIQPSATVDIDVSQLIASTVWIPITKPTEETTKVSSNQSSQNQSNSITNIIYPIISVTIGTSLFLAGVLFWFLWRRKRQYRRKSQASTIVPITLTSSDSTDDSRPSTFSSTRSVSPLINFLYEKDNISELEPPDIEVISVLDKPVQEDTVDLVNCKQGEKNRCYTLQEVDRMCMEAINGTITASKTLKKSPKQKRVSRRARVSKTLSNGSCKSQQSSNYSSSGYGSGSSSPALNQSNSATSLIGRRSTGGNCPNMDKRLDHFTVQNHGSQISDNNNRTPSSKGKSRDVDDEDDFYHHKCVVNNHVHFEGLPNFILYTEDTKV